MFSNVPMAPDDPILSLADEFKKEKRLNKINLGIGIYQDENGKTSILKSVLKAEKILLESEKDKSYSPMDGISEFNRFTKELIIGSDNPILNSERMITAQSIGGTGAVRIGAELLKDHTACNRVFISDPTWPNHHSIFKSLGFEIKNYRYYDKENNCLDFNGLLEDLNEVKEGDCVLLHACCHNPTGIDPTFEQWQQISKLLADKKALVFFDCAYQGFGNGIDEDTLAIRYFATQHPNLMIASSYSKNFGIYSERAGAFSMITPDKNISQKCLSQIKNIVRRVYSNSPSHGAKIVALVLSNKELYELWRSEVDQMRERITKMREKMVALLKEKAPNHNFDFILSQKGMFSFTGLTSEQVDLLKKHFAVYAVKSGRFNIAGINEKNIVTLCDAIAEVVNN